MVVCVGGVGGVGGGGGGGGGGGVVVVGSWSNWSSVIPDFSRRWENINTLVSHVIAAKEDPKL